MSDGNSRNPVKYPKIICLSFSGHYAERYIQVTEEEFKVISEHAKKNWGYVDNEETVHPLYKDNDRLLCQEDIELPVREVPEYIAYE